MPRLWLVRHGEARAAFEDPDRPLTADGRAAAARLAEWCAAQAVAPNEIRHSGILRAAQTAEILAVRLAPPAGVRRVRGLAPDDDPSTVAVELPHETSPLMLVTHMPFVGELAALLAGRRGSIAFGTCEIACFERRGTGFQLVETWRPATDD